MHHRFPRAFERAFPDEHACRAAFAAARWPNGFICPACAHDDAAYLAKRGLWQCRACRRQTSVTAGTALHATKLPLRTCLFAVWRLGHRRGRVSARQLMRETGICAYQTSWTLLHKLRMALAEHPLRLARAALDFLYAALPAAATAKRSRAGRTKAGLFVVAQQEVRAAVRPAPSSSTRAGAATARFFARLVRTLVGTHTGVSAAYLPSYVRALVFARNRAASVTSLRTAALARLVQARHRSCARVRKLGVDGVLDDEPRSTSAVW